MKKIYLRLPRKLKKRLRKMFINSIYTQFCTKQTFKLNLQLWYYFNKGYNMPKYETPNIEDYKHAERLFKWLKPRRAI